MAAQEDAAAIFPAQAVHDIGQALLGIVAAGGNIQRQAAEETAFIDIGEFKGNQAQADAAVPGPAQESGGQE